MPSVHPRIVNLADAEPQTVTTGSRFEVTLRSLSKPVGGIGLGCRHHELAPGKTAFPRHFHCDLEEAVYVLSGTGTVRIGEKTVSIGPGDYVTFTPGPEHAHQVVNTGTVALRYLAFSTQAKTDVVVYPDSKTVGIGGPGFGRDVMFRLGDAVPYGEGEEA